jgi:hypothetical protein
VRGRGEKAAGLLEDGARGAETGAADHVGVCGWCGVVQFAGTGFEASSSSIQKFRDASADAILRHRRASGMLGVRSRSCPHGQHTLEMDAWILLHCIDCAHAVVGLAASVAGGF